MSTSPQAAHHREAQRAKRVHRPALDGLRALAIVLVMIYHATGEKPDGGYFSVDVFFVLSGYLIGGLLVAEKRKWGSIDLPSFYLRRARRLFPGLVLAILGITVLCPHFVDEYARSTMRMDGLATIFYFINWRLIATGQSYFAQTGDPSPYRQMWTLAIEEQFYFVLPVLIIALMWLFRDDRRKLAWTLLGLSVLSALWMAHLYVPGQDPSRVYYGTDTRAQDLLLGSALAAWMSYANRRKLAANGTRLTIIGGVGTAVMAIMFLTFRYTSEVPYYGGFFVFVAATCAMIFVVELQPDGVFAKVYGFAPWAWIGKISYGLYLWHWPIFVMISPAHTDLPGPVIFVLRFALSFAIGAASFYFVEQPIRLKGIKRYVGHAAAVLVGFLVLPATGLVVAMASPPASNNPLLTAGTGQQQVSTGADPNAAVRLLIQGDSVAFGLATEFPSADYPKVGVQGSASLGCGTAVQWLAVGGSPQGSGPTPECDGQLANWKAAAQTFKPQVVLLVASGWDILDHVIDGKVVAETSPQYASYEISQLDKALGAAGPNAHLVIPNIPCINNSSSNADFQAIAKERNQPQRWAAMNAIFARFAAKHPGRVTIFDLNAKLCPNGKYTNTIDGVSNVRMDGLHFSKDGAKLFWKWVMPTILAQAGTTSATK